MNNLRLVRDNSEIFSPLFFSNFSAPNASILKYFFPQNFENNENCTFCIVMQKSTFFGFEKSIRLKNIPESSSYAKKLEKNNGEKIFVLS